MIYLISMSLFALAGFMIGKLKLKWPWVWLISFPTIVCAALMVSDELNRPERTEVSFSVLMPFFFIPPNFLAIVLGFWIGQKTVIKSNH